MIALCDGFENHAHFPDCGACRAVVAEVARLQSELAEAEAAISCGASPADPCRDAAEPCWEHEERRTRERAEKAEAELAAANERWSHAERIIGFLDGALREIEAETRPEDGLSFERINAMAGLALEREALRSTPAAPETRDDVLYRNKPPLIELSDADLNLQRTAHCANPEGCPVCTPDRSR